MTDPMPQPDRPAEAGPDPVGSLVRARRKKLGLTLAAVAERARVAKSYISMIENGRVAHPPSAACLTALAEALAMDRDRLLRAADWAQTPASVRAELARLEHDAEAGRDLAHWLAQATDRAGDGGRSLDALFASGQLRQRIERTLGAAPADDAGDTRAEAGDPGGLSVPRRLGRTAPLINKVAAGYPTGFTDLDYPARVADEYVPIPDLGDPDAFAAVVTGESMRPDYAEGDIVVFSPLADVEEGCDCFVRLEPNHDTTFKRVFFSTDESGRQMIRLQPLSPRFAPTILPREAVAGMYRAVWRMARV